MHTAQIKQGAVAQRYRAYSAGPMTRKPRREDLVAMTKAGKEFRPGQRVAYEVEHVVLEGEVEGNGISFESPDAQITKVVFYGGPPEAEEVVGSVEVGAAGTIVVTLEEEPTGDPEPIPADQIGL